MNVCIALSRSAVHVTTIRLRFGLILEAYCRSCGIYLQSLCRQVEAIDKLIKLSDMLKEEKEVSKCSVLVIVQCLIVKSKRVKSFPSQMGRGATLISVSLALSQTPAYIARSQMLS